MLQSKVRKLKYTQNGKKLSPTSQFFGWRMNEGKSANKK